MPQDFTWLDAVTQAELVRKKEVTPLELVVAAVLERRRAAELALELARAAGAQTVDITGGAKAKENAAEMAI